MKRKKTLDISQGQHDEPRKGNERGGGEEATSTKPATLGRRGFLSAGFSAAAAIAALPQLASSHQNRPKTQPRQRKVVLPPDFTFLLFPQPFEYRSCGGLLDLPMTVGLIGPAGKQVRVYNGNLPGPTLRLKANDTLKLNLVNQLPGNPPPPNPSATNLDYCNQSNAMNNPHCFNTTNLHT